MPEVDPFLKIFGRKEVVNVFLPSELIEQLPSGVVNLSEEVGIIILSGFSVLSQPKRENEVVSQEKNDQETDVIDSEPLVSSLGGDGGGG